jgi:hypothetical protein
MFRWRKRGRENQRFNEVTSQIGEIQTRMVVLVRRELVKHYEVLIASQLAQATVDRLFARPAALSGECSELIERLSGILARDNKFVRDAAFISLSALLELEVTNNDFKAERRILETLQWLNQIGEPPMGTTIQEIHRKLMMEDDLPHIEFHPEEEKTR